ncbi:TetR/AcrR family transcriptional regulator [Nonomuraea sp. NPDC050536]|uniref:TetR/AcrR family transcriptional regulator n=1 Tax=Nonomuraea sp. NPDC050536 TaxID=3364366 RepID=UPI0037CC28B2
MSDPIPSVWARPPRARREQPALSQRQIVAEAIQLLDEEGVEALSMRKLGTRLNAGATSLYTHVANKDELIELVVDEVFGEVSVPAAADGPDGWREAAAAFAASLRATILRHPWVASVIGAVGLIYFGPNMARLSEEILALFESAGFTLKLADHAMSVLVAFVLGASSADAAFLTMLARFDQDGRGLTERLWPAAEHAVRDHPRLRTLYAAKRRDDPMRTNEADFTLGVTWILDGLSAQLPHK